MCFCGYLNVLEYEEYDPWGSFVIPTYGLWPAVGATAACDVTAG